ncbi:MAG: hypothetical protein V4679_08695 [Pseudomonadota bacterium]
MPRHAALLLVLAMVTGGAQAADGGVPATPIRPWIDPVVSAGFERIVARCRFIYTQPLRPLRRVVLLDGDDVPATYALAGMAHDLVMTSHPVRPFLGRVMLRYSLVLKEPPADAQAQAEEAEHGTRAIETLEFAWQDRRWTFRGTALALFTGNHDRLDLPLVDQTPAEEQVQHALALRACLGG